MQIANTALAAPMGPSLLDRIGAFFDVLVAARNCSVAVSAGRRPEADALRALGIDPRAFDGMNLR